MIYVHHEVILLMIFTILLQDLSSEITNWNRTAIWLSFVVKSEKGSIFSGSTWSIYRCFLWSSYDIGGINILKYLLWVVPGGQVVIHEDWSEIRSTLNVFSALLETQVVHACTCVRACVHACHCQNQVMESQGARTHVHACTSLTLLNSSLDDMHVRACRLMPT